MLKVLKTYMLGKSKLLWLALSPLFLTSALSCRVVSKGPVLAFTTDSINLGTVSYRTTRVVDYDLTLENKGDADLIIQRFKPDCSCTKVKAESDTIAGGKSTQVHVEIEFSMPDSQPFEKSVAVYTNDSLHNPRIITFYGKTEFQMETSTNPRYKK